MLWENMRRVLSVSAVESKILATLGFCVAVSMCGLRWMKKTHILKRMEEERKRRARNLQHMEEAVRKCINQNSIDESRKILGMSLVELTENLRDGSLSPESVLYSYVGKALQVTRDINCVTIFLSDCDTQLQEIKEQKQKGLLYGVPISIKEHIGYKAQPSTCGLVQNLDEYEEEDSVLVKVLKKQGAIVFAKTNVSQSLICFETSNPIYGQTLNPHNPNKSAAGSTGGEGALIGAGGSILGFGTDLGGSIGLPSSFCGIVGFKPTPNRLSVCGVRPCIDGLLSVILCIGPMARDVDSLVLCMRAVLCGEMFRLDSTIPPLPFNDEVFFTTKPLRIGYYDTDGYFLSNPSMKRALQETKTLLEEAGHTLIPFTPPRVEYAQNELFIKALLGDGGATLLQKFKNNIVDPNLKAQVFLYKIPRFLKKILSLLMKPLEYRNEFITEWRKMNLDVILSPMLGPAFNLGYAGKLTAAVSYTMLYNVLGFPAGVVPVNCVTQADEEELKCYKGYCNDPWDKLFKKAVEGGVGLPLSVQCVALPYQDELCLRFMKEVETLSRLHSPKQDL